MDNIGAFAVPLLIALAVLSGTIKRTAVFSAFTEGAKEGLASLVSLAPTLLGLVFAVNMLSASGFFELAAGLLSPAMSALGFPPELLPLALIKPVSGSASAAVLSSVLETYGPDSFIGRVGSVMAGSTETTFYAITVYFGAAEIKKTGYALPAALAADLCGIILSAVVVSAFS